MFGAYLNGVRPRRVTELLKKEGPLSRSDTAEARDCLLLQHFISNGKRAGDLANLERTEVNKASPADDCTSTELKVRFSLSYVLKEHFFHIKFFESYQRLQLCFSPGRQIVIHFIGPFYGVCFILVIM
ncbi:hypothetical protein CI610_03464 [invertebrate metagenome]|uniref:Uncharacterized protein n=1 Tax=invertebrate metagenome TaxID=1711999 RepID=A0A2H9T307_9ZZZZ